MELIRGTTPTITYSFDDIHAADITVAVFCIKQLDKTIVEKNLADGLVSNDKLMFTLSQQDTLSLNSKLMAKVVLDWKLNTGIRGRSNIVEAKITDPGKDSVL